MGKHYDFSVYPEDDDNVKKVIAMYPRMRFSRLICMIIKDWLEQKDHGKGIDAKLNKALKDVEQIRRKIVGINDFI